MKTLDIKDLVHLTDTQLLEFCNCESTDKLSDSVLKEYILAGRETFTMGERINHLEKLTMIIIVERFKSGLLISNPVKKITIEHEDKLS